MFSVVGEWAFLGVQGIPHDEFIVYPSYGHHDLCIIYLSLESGVYPTRRKRSIRRQTWPSMYPQIISNARSHKLCTDGIMYRAVRYSVFLYLNACTLSDTYRDQFQSPSLSISFYDLRRINQTSVLVSCTDKPWTHLHVSSPIVFICNASYACNTSAMYTI